MRLRPHTYWAVILAGPLGLLGAYLACAAVNLPWLDQDIIARYPVLAAPFLAAGAASTLRTLAIVVESCAVLFILGGIAALLVRRQWVLWVLQKSYILVYLLFAFYVHSVGRLTGIIMEANVRLDGVAPTAQSQFFLRWHFVWPAILIVLFMAVLHVFSLRRDVYVLYTGVHDDTPATGDQIIENVLSNGKDPRFRQSMLGSILVHVTIILIIPWLFSLFLHVTPYDIFKGRGTAVTGHEGATAVQVKVIKKKTGQKKPKLIVNPKASILYYVPGLDDSDISRDLDKSTALTYAADRQRVLSNGSTGKGDGHGFGKGRGGGKGTGFGLGKGGPGNGGWPDGTDGGVVRFIRIEYNGTHWNDGMDNASGADLNFLKKIHEETGFPIASASESNPIRALKKYPPGKAPPFLFMTGDENIDIPQGDINTLRDYLMSGGMLFADCGSPQWNQAFHRFAAQLFPDSPLRDIADDDSLYQQPFEFSNGAPPLWHHGGMRALGIKQNGRWVVFYHPGDVNDAWKNGHSGMSEELAEQAYDIGINVVYYAFTEYLNSTRQYRK